MFNFKDQQIKITQKQNQYNQVKNLRKEISRQSPFKYASKKISFNVKNRSEFWDKLEQSYLNDKDKIDFLIMNEIKNILTNDTSVNYQTEALESVMYTPVSPVLATTLIMLNKALFKCDTFDKYVNNTENQVYAYTHWIGDNFLNKDSLVINNPFGNETDKYMQILPGYNNIEIMKFYKGYQLYMTDYDTTTTEIKKDNATTHTEPKFWGSYNIDTKRFQRIFKTQPDIVDDKTGTVGDISDLKDINGDDIETLNKHPEIDSYLYADGVFKRLMDSPYNSQSYQISVIRGGYGFGPINIACFLKAKEFNIERITDIISGILISEDSGMPLVDAIKGIQEWRNVNTGSDIDIMFNSLSDIRILRYLEYIGSIFFTAILGSSLKEKPLLNLPLTNSERKVYDIGYLMGHNHDIFAQMFKNGIKNKIWLKESTEIFSFEVPCILYGTTPTSGIFKIGDYVKNYSDSLLLSSEPLDYAFNISSILEKEKALTDYIIPQKGYTIFDFVTKGLNNCLITEVLKNIDSISKSKKFVYGYDNSGIYRVQENDIELIGNNISGDFLIAPRKERSIEINNKIPTANYYILSQDYDNTKCVVNYDVNSSYNYIQQHQNVIYQIDWKVIILRLTSNSTSISIKYPDYTNYVQAVSKFGFYYLQFNFDDKKSNQLYLPKDTEIWIQKVKYVTTNDHYINFKYDTTTNKIITASGSPTSSITDLTDIDALDENDNIVKLKFDNIDIIETDTSKNTLSNYSIIIDNAIYYNEYILNNFVQNKNEVKVRKTRSINIINLQNVIYSLFSLCGLYFNFDLKYNNGVLQNQENELFVNIYNFLNRFGLCILKLSTINAFCTSYSLDLLSLPDTTRQFYEIYKSYLSDFIDIKQEIQN